MKKFELKYDKRTLSQFCKDREMTFAEKWAVVRGPERSSVQEPDLTRREFPYQLTPPYQMTYRFVFQILDFLQTPSHTALAKGEISICCCRL